MKYPHAGFTASVHHNWEEEKEFWVYTIRRTESGEMLYHGFSRDALEALQTVAARMRVLGMRRAPSSRLAT
jgi:hypothetical protein